MTAVPTAAITATGKTSESRVPRLISDDTPYRRVFDFWRPIFAVSFRMGVVTGMATAFKFGTKWGVLAVKTVSTRRQPCRQPDGEGSEDDMKADDEPELDARQDDRVKFHTHFHSDGPMVRCPDLSLPTEPTFAHPRGESRSRYGISLFTIARSNPCFV